MATSERPSDVDFSVLIPLQEAREVGDECLRAWTTGQTFPRERYEIVALAPGIDRTLEQRWKSAIGNGDIWVEQPVRNEFELFNIGARHARGRFLFLTEVHCVPEPDCLETMHAHLIETGDVGARVRTVGSPVGTIGAFEHRVFEDALRQGEDFRHWEKVLIHGFAIRPDAYEEGGGLDPTLGEFSPWALSVALWERGHRVGFAPRSQVRHVFGGDLDETFALIRDFSRGEIDFRGRAEDLAEKYLEERREWTQRWTYTPDSSRARLRGAIATMRVSRDGVQTLVAEVAVVAAGLRTHIVAKRIELALTKLALFVRRDRDRRFDTYRHFWHVGQRLGAIDQLVAEPPCVRTPAPERLAYDFTTTDAPRMSGVNVVEEWEGKPFRWGGPLTLVEVSLPRAARLEGRLEFLPIRGARPPNLRLAIGGRAIPTRTYRYEPGAVRFPVTGSGPQWLTVACDAFRPRRQGIADWRALGLPLVALSFNAR